MFVCGVHVGWGVSRVCVGICVSGVCMCGV